MTKKIIIKNHDYLQAAAAGMYTAAENLAALKEKVVNTADKINGNGMTFSEWKIYFASSEYKTLENELKTLEKERKQAAAAAVLYNQRFKDILKNNVIACLQSYAFMLDGKKPHYKKVQDKIINELLFYTGGKYASFYSDRFGYSLIVSIQYPVENAEYYSEYKFNFWILENDVISKDKINELKLKDIMNINNIDSTAAAFVNDLEKIEQIKQETERKLKEIENVYKSTDLIDYMSIGTSKPSYDL